MTQQMYDIVTPIKRPPRRRRRTNLTLRLAALLTNAMTNRDTIAEAARRLGLRPKTTQIWFRSGMVDQMPETSHQKSGCCALCGHESGQSICGPCSTTLE